jgi:hypothetical protein
MCSAGIKCFGGYNSLPDDNCGMAPLYTTIYILFNLAYNVFIILLLKFGSSNILWFCMTLQVPIANLVFGIPFMPGHRKCGNVMLRTLLT